MPPARWGWGVAGVVGWGRVKLAGGRGMGVSWQAGRLVGGRNGADEHLVHRDRRASAAPPRGSLEEEHQHAAPCEVRASPAAFWQQEKGAVDGFV